MSFTTKYMKLDTDTLKEKLKEIQKRVIDADNDLITKQHELEEMKKKFHLLNREMWTIDFIIDSRKPIRIQS